MTTPTRLTTAAPLRNQELSARNLWSLGLARLRELYRYRYLLQNLVVRDLKVRYKNSVLGVLWSLLNPLLMMVVFSLVFNVLMPNNNIRQYGTFILVGLLPWNFFSSSLMAGSTSITANAVLVKKVYFPRELLPLAVILANLVHFLIALVVLVVFLYASGLGLTINALWVPLILVTQVIFTLGLCLLLGALHVTYRDVVMVIDVLLLAGFFLTPVIYSLDFFNNAAQVLGQQPAVVMRWLNPMASLIDGYRTVLWGTTQSAGPASMFVPFFLRTLVTAVLIFIVGYGFFLRREHMFAEKL